MTMVTKYRATGRRKEAVAVVEVFPGNGQFIVNNISCDSYFSRESDRLILRQPFKITNTLNKFDVKAKVKGGGVSGQAGALKHAVSRALSLMDDNYKLTLRRAGFLTRDPRAKERKKYGQKGARKRFQWTKR